MVTMLIGSGWLCGAAMAADPPTQQGELTITEIMAYPNEVPIYSGEWFEIYNTTDQTLELSGMRVSGEGGSDAGFTILGSLELEAGAYAIFGVSDCSDDGDPLCAGNAYNGGIDVDYLYDRDDLDLDEDGDTVRLSIGSVVLDVVTWDAADWVIQQDYALQANINAFDLEWANNNPANWCSADTPYGARALYGTPGAANQPCDGSSLDDDGDGFTEATGDCDDDDPSVNPDATDGDPTDPECTTYGDAARSCCGSADDDADCNGSRDDGVTDDDGDGRTEAAGDCDDTNPNINPDAAELGGQSGVDDNCNGVIDDTDDDRDGFSEAPAWYPSCDPDAVEPLFDCDDTDDEVNPNEPDTPYDGIDNDCDGYDVCDVDGDGYLADSEDVCPGEDCCTESEFTGHPDGPLLAGDCDDNDVDVNPEGSEGTPDEGGFADGLDNDCNGIVDDPYQDLDGDGYSASDGDCLDDPDDPISIEIYPGQPELCDDFYDNDCDGLYNDGCENRGRYANLQGGRICGVTSAGGSVLALLALLGAVTRRRQTREA
ncbi:MAG: MYXO-CTERM domain-containing protein [Myxococcota bacterium]|jgi:MYXO-CTERM domain-containing protein